MSAGLHGRIPSEHNPWIDAAPLGRGQLEGPPSVPPRKAVEPLQPSLPGPDLPQRGVPAPERGGLRVRAVRPGPTLWVVGAHGGSGESSIASLCPQWSGTGRAWPSLAGASCVLVARTHYSGLTAAQAALTQWAAWTGPPPMLEGLILIADAPKKLPRPLRDLAALVAGGSPRTWHLPWIEEWRLGEVSADSRPVSQLVSTLTSLAPASAL